MDGIYRYTDPDGDRVEVDSCAGGVLVSVESRGRLNCAELGTAEVDRLRAALAPYGTKPEEPKPATSIVEGREYRLLPGALTLRDMESSAVADGVTRVRVVNADSGYRNGTVRVVGLDGAGTSHGGQEYIVMPRFLAPLTDEAPTTDPDPRRVAAWHKARELAGSHADTYDVLRLTEFLYGEAA